MTPSLVALFGSETAARVLMFLNVFGQGYGREIADLYRAPLSQVQKQLSKFERAGLLVSRARGRTREFSWSDRNPMVGPLRALLAEAEFTLPPSERERFESDRRRPRRAGKPL